MRIFINIVLTVIAIILTVTVLDKSKLQRLKDAYVEETVYNNKYTLIPKNYGDDTIIVKSQNAQVIYEIDELFGDTTYYYLFISNNKAIRAVKGEKYRLQE